ncbi:MAG: MG2 domain-containing protein [Proteobacteria bacterium]|nr:MG2 domain-containing protein [Pseudomonadota bacterium]
MARASEFFRQVVAAFSKILKFLIGSWSPPKWLMFLGLWLIYPFKKMFAWILSQKEKSAPKFYAILTSILLLIGVGSYGGYYWWKLPPPVITKVTIVKPTPQIYSPTSKPSTLFINFQNSAAKLDLVGKALDKGVVLSPAMAGSWSFIGDSQLQFLPEKDWVPNQKYTVKIEKRILNSKIVLSTYSLEFTTAKFSFRNNKSQFYQDPFDPLKKILTYDLSFTHPIDRKSFENAVKLSRSTRRINNTENAEGKDLYDVTFNYKPFDMGVYIQSENLPLPERELELVLKIDTGAQSVLGGNSAEKMDIPLSVPALDSFLKVVSANASYIKEESNGDLAPLLAVSFTTNLKPSDLIKSIELYELPINRPINPEDPRDSNPDDPEAARARMNYAWSDANEINEKILKESRKLSVSLLDVNQKAPIPVIGFKHDVAEKRHLFVTVKRGLEAFGGYKLSDTWQRILKIPAVPTDIKFMHEGSLLSMAGEKRLNITSNGAKGVKTTLYRVAPDKLNHFVRFNESQFTSPSFWSFSSSDFSERFEDFHEFQSDVKTKTNYFGLDLNKFLRTNSGVDQSTKRRGLFLAAIEEYDPESLKSKRAEQSDDDDEPMPEYKYEFNDSRFKDKRFVLVTDLGLMAKRNKDGTFIIYVMELLSGKPAANVDVGLLARNGVTLVSQKTDSNGTAVFKSFVGLTAENEPVAWTARRDDDLSFLPVNRDSSRRLSTSRFDVGGEVLDPSSIDGYVFSDRGLYRPGEDVIVGSIIKGPGLIQLPAGLPLELILTNPRGQEVLKRSFEAGKFGFDEHRIKTETHWLTGPYIASVQMIKDDKRKVTVGSTNLRIQEFLPDRLKSDTDLVIEKGDLPSKILEKAWIKPSQYKVRTKVENLFGGPAEGNKVQFKYSLVPSFPEMKGYEDWNFFFPESRTDAVNDRSFGDFETDEQGMVFESLPDLNNDNGFYKLSVVSEAFEKSGGRFVARVAQAIVADRDYILGVKSDGDLQWIKQNSKRHVDIISLNNLLQKVETKGLKLSLFRTKYLSTLVAGSDGLYRYQSKQVEEIVESKDISIGAEGFRYQLPSDKSGDYDIKFFNSDGATLASVHFSIAGSGDLDRGLDRNSELKLKLSKKEYDIGEEADLEIKAPYAGSGYITVESDRVLSSTWYKSGQASSVQKFKIPKGITGNAYVHVTHVRSSSSPEIYTKSLSYAITPLRVSIKNYSSSIKLEHPEVTKPDRKVPVNMTLSEPMRVVLFAVDEGILQVARYRNPDPLKHFFRKKAHEVETRQILDLILPEYSIAMKAAAGGDQDGALARNINPFRRKSLPPAAFWSGIFDGKAGVNVVDVELPSHFNGSYRLIAVAIGDSSFGTASSKGRRVGSFVISPVLPLFVAPGDQFVGEVTISNQSIGSGKDAKVIVEATASEGLTLSKPRQELTVSEGKEVVAKFEFKAEGVLKSHSVNFKVSLANNSAESVIHEETLSIRPGTPYATTVGSKIVKGSSDKIEVTREMYHELYDGKVSFSSLPLGFAQALVSFLEAYPHGCTEQITSQSLPIVAFVNNKEIISDKSKSIAFLEKANAMIRTRQSMIGGFGYWNSNGAQSGMLNAYVGLLYVEMLDSKVMKRDSSFQKLMNHITEYIRSNRVNRNPSGQLDVAFSTYILARAGLVNAQFLHEVYEDFSKNLPVSKELNWTKSLSAVYIASSYKLRGMDKDADRIIKNVSFKSVGELPSTGTFYHSLDSLKSQYIYLMSKHFPNLVGKDAAEYIGSLATLLSDQRHNTYILQVGRRWLSAPTARCH